MIKCKSALSCLIPALLSFGKTSFNSFSSFSFKNIYLFIYLAALGFNCGTWSLVP